MRIAVRAIIIKDDTIFLVRLKGYNGNPENEYFCTIGGGIEEGEDLIEGLKREVFEETGVNAEVGKLICIQQFQYKGSHIEFFFHVTNTADFQNIDTSKSTHGEIEIAEFGFYDPSSIVVPPKFLQDISVSELMNSSEVRLFNNYPVS